MLNELFDKDFKISTTTKNLFAKFKSARELLLAAGFV